MRELIEALFNTYYEGFTRRKTEDRLPVDFDHFVLRAIDEFGVDQYMEEIFRAADQQEMSDDEFNEFLKKRGIAGDRIDDLAKGLSSWLCPPGLLPCHRCSLRQFRAFLKIH